MDADDFRRIALSLEGAEESSHMGQTDFRVGGRIFATRASAYQGYGNLMLTSSEQQAPFVEELPEVSFPSRVKGDAISDRTGSFYGGLAVAGVSLFGSATLVLLVPRKARVLATR